MGSVAITRERRSVQGIRFRRGFITEVIRAARDAGCYKLIATSRESRPGVRELYRGLGVCEYGTEFRMDLSAS